MSMYFAVYYGIQHIILILDHTTHVNVYYEFAVHDCIGRIVWIYILLYNFHILLNYIIKYRIFHVHGG